jgi:hypothetical protein
MRLLKKWFTHRIANFPKNILRTTVFHPQPISIIFDASGRQWHSRAVLSCPGGLDISFRFVYYWVQHFALFLRKRLFISFLTQKTDSCGTSCGAICQCSGCRKWYVFSPKSDSISWLAQLSGAKPLPTGGLCAYRRF